MPGSVALLHVSRGGSSPFQGTIAALFSSKPRFLAPNVTGDPQPWAQPRLPPHPRIRPWVPQHFWVPGLGSHPAPVAITTNEDHLETCFMGSFPLSESHHGSPPCSLPCAEPPPLRAFGVWCQRDGLWQVPGSLLAGPAGCPHSSSLSHLLKKQSRSSG